MTLPIREASNNTPITISAANMLVMTVDEEDGGNEGVEDCVENIVGREEVKMTAGVRRCGSDDTADDVTCEVVKCGANGKRLGNSSVWKESLS